MRDHKRRGFSLIELLVVIAIIAILAAILFPIFINARESGRRASCISHLKQIGGVLTMYRDDWNGRNCGIWQRGAVNDTGTFYWVITTYAKAKLGSDARNIFKCPSAPWLKQQMGTVMSRTRVGFAYQLNETGWADGRFLFADGQPASLAFNAADSYIRKPGEKIFVTECCGWVGFGVGYHDGKVGDNENCPDPPGSGWGWKGVHPEADESIPVSEGPIGRYGGTKSKIYNLRASHGGGANFLMYDNHVVNLRFTTGRNWSIVR